MHKLTTTNKPLGIRGCHENLFWLKLKRIKKLGNGLSIQLFLVTLMIGPKIRLHQPKIEFGPHTFLSHQF